LTSAEIRPKVLEVEDTSSTDLESGTINGDRSCFGSIALTIDTRGGDSLMRKDIYYFEESGPENTEQTIEIAYKRAKELDIDQIVIASTHGQTAHKVLDAFENLESKIVVVTISRAFGKEGWIMEEKVRQELKKRGATVLTTLHALGDDVNTAFAPSDKAAAFNMVVARTLYRFSQGMKVCVEIVLMAAENGAIDVDREVIAIGGTGDGADTAVAIKPAYARDFLNLEIREILAKPRKA